MKTFSLIQCALRVLVISTFALSFASQAALVGRDLDGNLATFEAYYDTDQNITWLADANYAQTSGYDADGLMTWVDANAWAAALNFGGISGWRLPSTIDVGNDGYTYNAPFGGEGHYYWGVDAGFNLTSHSEMSYMFYEILGNLAAFDTFGNAPQPGWGLTNTGPFFNFQLSVFWSATEFALYKEAAWFFLFSNGAQGQQNITRNLHAWAVHSGDVGASVVPVPAAAWLFSSALLGLVGLKRKK